jgi:hypothetical protein
MFCQGKAVYLNASKPTERMSYINGFQRCSEPGWTEEDKIKYDHRFLVGTTGILGTGVTLNLAERMVLDSCLYVAREEDQAYARIDRMGNRNPRVITYRFVTNADIEIKILWRQANRKALFEETVNATLRGWMERVRQQEEAERAEEARLAALEREEDTV